ncbi:Glutathione-dependent formaldehyde-activating enzyme [compost metagenome]
MIAGSCHCGAVTWRFESEPDAATICNCTVCRRYGTLWIYGHENEDVFVSGPTTAYMRGEKSLSFNFCPACGCVAYWRGTEPAADGRRRLAVNVRLAEPEAVAHIPIQRFDGLHTWDDLPRDGSTVGDRWF